MTTEALRLLERATTSLASARLLLDAGDANSAVSRAYYAVFDAARAALAAHGLRDPFSIKTHHGLWAEFSQSVIRAGLIPRDAAKVVTGIEKLRLAADYLAEPLPQEVARQSLDDAERFLAACRKAIAEQGL
jgi:uncharacterized protein (UPF0332 family)